MSSAGWQGYWIDAARTLRMEDDAVIILDPVNRDVIDAALRTPSKNSIGGSCTLSLMVMALGSLFRHDLVEWMTCMTYQAASRVSAQTMHERLLQMGEAHLAAKRCSRIRRPRSSTSIAKWPESCDDKRFPTEHTKRAARGVRSSPGSTRCLGSCPYEGRRGSGREAPRPTRSLGRENDDPSPLISFVVRCAATAGS